MNPNMLVDFGVMTVERLAEIYGEMFSKLVSDAAVGFVSKKIAEEPPHISNLQQAAEYIKSRVQKYPMGHCGFWYGIAKAESRFQGSAGPAVRLTLTTIVKKVTELDGLADVIGNSEDTTEALSAFKRVALSMDMLDESSCKIEKDGIASVLRVNDCPNGDGCKQMIDEKIVQSFNKKPVCTICIGCTVTAEIATKNAHDYEIIDFKPPNCIARIVKL